MCGCLGLAPSCEDEEEGSMIMMTFHPTSLRWCETMYIGKYGHISDAWGSITAFQLFWDRNTSYVTLHHSLKENRVGRESTFPRASRPQGWYCPPGTVDAVKTVGKNSESAGLSSNPDSTSYSCALNKLLNLSVSSALGYKVDIMKASNLGGLC